MLDDFEEFDDELKVGFESDEVDDELRVGFESDDEEYDLAAELYDFTCDDIEVGHPHRHRHGPHRRGRRLEESLICDEIDLGKNWKDKRTRRRGLSGQITLECNEDLYMTCDEAELGNGPHGRRMLVGGLWCNVESGLGRRRRPRGVPPHLRKKHRRGL
jgi:hypothetical protein